MPRAGVWSVTATLTATDGAENDDFGFSSPFGISIDGGGGVNTLDGIHGNEFWLISGRDSGYFYGGFQTTFYTLSSIEAFSAAEAPQPGQG